MLHTLPKRTNLSLGEWGTEFCMVAVMRKIRASYKKRNCEDGLLLP